MTPGWSRQVPGLYRSSATIWRVTTTSTTTSRTRAVAWLGFDSVLPPTSLHESSWLLTPASSKRCAWIVGGTGRCLKQNSSRLTLQDCPLLRAAASPCRSTRHTVAYKLLVIVRLPSKDDARNDRPPSRAAVAVEPNQPTKETARRCPAPITSNVEAPRTSFPPFSKTCIKGYDQQGRRRSSGRDHVKKSPTHRREAVLTLGRTGQLALKRTGPGSLWCIVGSLLPSFRAAVPPGGRRRSVDVDSRTTSIKLQSDFKKKVGAHNQ